MMMEYKHQITTQEELIAKLKEQNVQLTMKMKNNASMIGTDHVMVMNTNGNDGSVIDVVEHDNASNNTVGNMYLNAIRKK